MQRLLPDGGGVAGPAGAGLEDHGLRWTHAPDVVVHVLPDGRTVTLNRDPEVTAASLDAFAAGDGRRWLEMYERWLAISEPLLEAMLRPFPPARPALRLVREQPVSELLRLARQLVLPARAPWVTSSSPGTAPRC